MDSFSASAVLRISTVRDTRPLRGVGKARFGSVKVSERLYRIAFSRLHGGPFCAACDD